MASAKRGGDYMSSGRNATVVEEAGRAAVTALHDLQRQAVYLETCCGGR
jgi:hypothetical protein